MFLEMYEANWIGTYMKKYTMELKEREAETKGNKKYSV